MKRTSKSVFATLFLLLSLFSFSSCITDKEAQQIFGNDAEYFVGLQLLSEGNEKAARNKLKKCAKKGTYYCSRKSAETLCTLGNIQEQTQAYIKLYETYKDSDSLLMLVKKLDDCKEIHKIVEFTNNIDLENEYNEIIKIRLESLKARNDSRYESEVYKWFTTRPISSYHYKFYRDFYNHPDFHKDFDIDIANEDIHYAPQQFIMNYRIETYNRNYLYTYDNADKILEYFDSNLIPLSSQLASDLGKAYLYGNSNYSGNGIYLSQIAEKYKSTDLEFYFWFYTGRLFNKADLYYTHAKKSFEKAMNAAKTPEQKDNALWYLLDSSLSFSLSSIEESIGKYSRQWSDPEYFDDFFDSLLTSLLTGGRWDSLKTIYKAIDGYGSKETVAKFAYIYGRLVQTGKATGTEEDVKEAFTKALDAGFSIYYKALAAYELDLSEEELEQVFCKSYGKESKIPDIAAEKLLTGYAYFGFPQLIYPEWEKLYKNGLSPESSLYISNFLRDCSTGNDDYYTKALRIASRVIAETDQTLPKDYWKPIYPKNYQAEIESLSAKYELEPAIVYAMIRSESYFNPTVASHAGAIGLAQLMESTGNDIARKLKKQDYSLTDPKINLEFGTFYLAELVRRCEGSYLSAFFSYNAGITRVRRWKKNTIIGFGQKTNMPLDLFLETLPYPETREYGRKLVSASVMYQWLYSETPKESFNQIMETLFAN